MIASSGSSVVDKKRSPRRFVPFVVGAVVVLDQLTKALMVERANSPISVIGTDVEFRVVRNPGGAFSTFTNATPVLAVLAIGLTIWLVLTVRKATDRWTVLGLSLVLGGALGNLSDRFFRSPGFLRGHVVDFVRVATFPSFNVADSAVTVGAAVLIIASFRTARPAPPDPQGHEAKDREGKDRG